MTVFPDSSGIETPKRSQRKTRLIDFYTPDGHTKNNVALGLKMPYTKAVSWKVEFTHKAYKQKEKLPEAVRESLAALVFELESVGPVRGNWKNYSKLGQFQHHCHIKSGRPTYVACWEVKNKSIQVLEIYYVGTHEKAP